MGPSRAASAQGRVLLEGALEVETWLTDDGSRLLARNEGSLAPLGRLYLWGAVEPVDRLQVYAVAEGTWGYESDEAELGAELEQLAVRWTARPALVVDAGRISSPMGVFGNRRFATQNSVIGVPDVYPVSYPRGVQLSGQVGRVDYRVAAIDLPASSQWVPEPTRSVRPAVGGGLTPAVGVRLGASWSAGPYLNEELPVAVLGGRAWDDYDQRIVAFDGRVSGGYFEFWSELAFSSYEVPDLAEALDGIAAYAELKYTWTPRFFTATRLEVNDYPSVRFDDDDGTLVGRLVMFYDVEVGLGYRFGADFLTKVSFRKDRWDVAPERRANTPDGYAIAAQVAWTFDALSWMDPLR
jgi:hypothetical protein